MFEFYHFWHMHFCIRFMLRRWLSDRRSVHKSFWEGYRLIQHHRTKRTNPTELKFKGSRSRSRRAYFVPIPVLSYVLDIYKTQFRGCSFSLLSYMYLIKNVYNRIQCTNLLSLYFKNDINVAMSWLINRIFKRYNYTIHLSAFKK